MKTIIALVSKINKTGLIYWIESINELSENMIRELSSDPDTLLLLNPKREWEKLDFKLVSIVSFLPGVTDNSAAVFKELLALNSFNSEILSVHSGSLFFDNESPYFNSLIEKLSIYNKDTLIEGKIDFPKEVNIKHFGVEYFNLNALSDAELTNLSVDKKWALSLDEMKAIKDYYQKDTTLNKRREKGLNSNPTDVELEIIAQTWSEHCKHKIFNAQITYRSLNNENEQIDSIYKSYIKGATKNINSNWTVSVFNDNAGIVDWDEDNYLAIKVETHNSPSALDPYGGALTGILGVNRDILGTGLGFKPIANTDVFCVGEWDETTPLPKRIKHPKTILKGIHRGIEDGGNKSGIPTVNGAICFDENYTGKPLVYCGTVGIAPKRTNGRDNAFKYHQENNLIMMSGGLVGLDGIHGATMSSIALDENVPNTMVQIGDPFTQKKLLDFILELRDLNLIEGITDNGAGGLSSSIGEMSEKTNGAFIDVSTIPLKYKGLAPWEIVVSESQERMSFAIKEENLESVLKISKQFNVETNNIGKFENSGFFEIKNKATTVGLIDLDFLHNGLPKLKLQASESLSSNNEKPTWKKNQIERRSLTNLTEALIKVISDKNIVSKKDFTENYDQEVQAATIVKGLDGLKQDSPNDSGVIWLKSHGGNAQRAVAVGSGIQYMYSHLDCELMAKLSFDEAMRSVVSIGANPEKVAMCDNFCWPDPIKSEQNPDGEHKLFQLVKTCKGLYDIAVNYKAPLISGKDSMKNDFIEGDLKISVPPTLLMTAIGLVENVENIKKSGILNAGMLVYQIGPKFNSNYFGHFLSKYYQVESNHQFAWDLQDSIQFYKKYHQSLNLISSSHDVSEGGVIISLVESLFLNKLGINLQDNKTIEELFNEYPSQFIVSINKENKEQFEKTFENQFSYLGETVKDFNLKFKNEEIDLAAVLEKWSFKWK